MDELLPDEGIIEPAADNSSSHQEGLDKTVVLPDLRNEKLQQDVKRQNPARNTDEMSVLTADTIDLRNSLQQLQKDELSKEPHENYQTDSNMRKPVQAEPVQVEVLEPVTEEKKEAPTLDSLLQSMNIGGRNKKKKKKGQEEDPFEFLGSVDDF